MCSDLLQLQHDFEQGIQRPLLSRQPAEHHVEALRLDRLLGLGILSRARFQAGEKRQPNKRFAKVAPRNRRGTPRRVHPEKQPVAGRLVFCRFHSAIPFVTSPISQTDAK